MNEEIYTIDELSKSIEIKYNETRLSKLLHINRGTLRKYRDDMSGKYHCIRFIDNKYKFFALLRRTLNDKLKNKECNE